MPLPIARLSDNRSLLEVGPVVDAIPLLLRTEESATRRYIVCDREPVSVSGTVAATRKRRGRRPLLFSIQNQLVQYRFVSPDGTRRGGSLLGR